MEEYEVMEAAQKLIHWWECANEQYAELQPELSPDELGPPPPNVGVELLRQYVEMNKDELLRIEEFEKEPRLAFRIKEMKTMTDFPHDDINIHELTHGSEQIAQGVELFKKGQYRIALEMFDQGTGRVRGEANKMSEHIEPQKMSDECAERLFGHMKNGGSTPSVK